MARSSRRTASRRTERATSRNRHGRGIRASVTGPYLPVLQTRVEVFEADVASAVEYLRDLWPDELDGVRFEVAGLPVDAGAAGLARWRSSPSEKRVILYRLPIERLVRRHDTDELARRLAVEACVFRAVAELLGRDPWDLAPDRYRHG